MCIYVCVYIYMCLVHDCRIGEVALSGFVLAGSLQKRVDTLSM